MLPKNSFGVGLGLMGFGVVLLLGVAAFYAYGAYGRSQLDGLNVAEQPAPGVARDVVLDGIDLSQAGRTSSFQGGRDRSTGRLASLYSGMYPGADLHPKYWSEPPKAGTDVRVESSLPDGYSPASADDFRRFADPKSRGTRLRIPVINVDSSVEELAIDDLGDSREYETPDNTVGHIPDTADPGELGNGWFFGHLESPFKGEGSVFQRLPEIPQLLRHFSEVGEGAVYVVVESNVGEYLYEVVATEVMRAEDLRLYDTDGVYITLVTCVPRLDYSHRLLVTAKLVGVRA